MSINKYLNSQKIASYIRHFAKICCGVFYRFEILSDPSYRIVERRRYPCMIKTTKDFRFDLHNNVVFANGDPPLSRETQSITSTYRRDVVNSQWYLSENLFPSYAFAFDRSSSSPPWAFYWSCSYIDFLLIGLSWDGSLTKSSM